MNATAKIVSGIAITLVIAMAGVLAQSSRVVFEVASIKPRVAAARSTSMVWPSGRFIATNCTVADLLVFAYSQSIQARLQRDYILGEPSWIDTDRFDIQATGGFFSWPDSIP